jgi:hypothetical protein
VVDRGYDARSPPLLAGQRISRTATEEHATLAAKPNFFVVGAPKCGTTALHRYLRPHPNIFMPRVKEPHFFAADLGTYRIAKTMEDYARLFAESTGEHLRVGEASVYYLRSSVAIPAIRAFNPDAKIIAMFRNPVDVVYALHSELLYWSEETVADFEVAWHLQERRRQGFDLPTCRSPLLVQYAEVGQFGTQTQRLLASFPREQVKLILFDDFADSPQKVYDEVIEFLGIPHDNRTDFPRINENRRVRLLWLKHLIRRPPPLLRQTYMSLKRTVGGRQLDSFKRKIVTKNSLKESRPPLSPAFRAELVEAFRGEVALLSELLGRDLSHWR